MSIIQRPNRRNSFWVDFRVDGKRIRRKSPIQTLEGAHAFELELQRKLLGAEADDDRLPQHGATLYREFAERWLTDYVTIANKATTQREKRSALSSRLLPAFGHVPLKQITTGMVDEQVSRWRREKLGMKHINNLLTIFRCSLRCAEEWGLIDRAPIIRHYNVMPPLPQFLRPEESERVLAELPAGFWRTFALFVLRTGARFGEAAALRWEDLELNDPIRPYVTIRRSVSLDIVDTTKTPTSRRTIPLVSEVVIALRTMRHSKPSSPWVFQTKRGKFLRPGRCSYILKRACEKAGVRSVTWHKLRHTCATQLMASGVPIMAIKAILGHTSLTTTAIYTHVVPELTWDYMNVLSPGTKKAPIDGAQKTLNHPEPRRSSLDVAINRA